MPHSNREDHNNYIRAYLKRRYDLRRKQAIELLGGRCVECGSEDDLQFDHIDQLVKSFDIAERLAQYTWSRIESELKKCQLLCSKCHLAKSGRQLAARSPLRDRHGRIIGFEPLGREYKHRNNPERLSARTEKA